MTCCRCNRTGSCKNCSCSKRNSKCTSCLPSRLNKCSDIDHVVESSPQDTVSCENISPELEVSPQVDPTAGTSVNQHAPINTHYSQWKLSDTLHVSEPLFSWGSIDSSKFIAEIKEAYNEVVHWKMNLFLVPFEAAGKCFVAEQARLFRAIATIFALSALHSGPLWY